MHREKGLLKRHLSSHPGELGWHCNELDAYDGLGANRLLPRDSRCGGWHAETPVEPG